VWRLMRWGTAPASPLWQEALLSSFETPFLRIESTQEKRRTCARNLAPDFSGCYGGWAAKCLRDIRPSSQLHPAGAVNAGFVRGPNLEITDLHTLVDPSDPKFGVVTLVYAGSINDKGKIVGLLFDFNSAPTTCSS
jgi:hypothetical protein